MKISEESIRGKAKGELKTRSIPTQKLDGMRKSKKNLDNRKRITTTQDGSEWEKGEMEQIRLRGGYQASMQNEKKKTKDSSALQNYEDLRIKTDLGQISIPSILRWMRSMGKWKLYRKRPKQNKVN